MPPAISTTMGVAGCRHNYTADAGAEAHVALTAGAADLDILVLLIADRSDRGCAVYVY